MSPRVLAIAGIAILRWIVQLSGRKAVTAAQLENASEPLAVDIAVAEKPPHGIEQFKVAGFRDLLRHLRKMPAQDRNGVLAVCAFVEPGDRTAVSADEGENLRPVLPRPGPSHRRDIALVGPD